MNKKTKTRNMDEGWKQIWDDIRQSLLGKATAQSGEQGSQTREIEASDAHIATTSDPKDQAIEEPEAQPAQIAEKTSPHEDPQIITLDSLAIESTTIEIAPPSPSVQTPWKRRRVLAVSIAVVALVSSWLAISRSGLLASWIAPTAPAPDVIATYDGGQITVADLEAHMSLILPDHPSGSGHIPDEVIMVVEDLVVEEVVRQWAAERQPDADETFRHTMEHINEDLNLQMFESQLHEGGIPVAESEIRDYYDANRTQFSDLPLSEVREQIRLVLVAEQEQDYVEGYIQLLEENASITRNFDLLSAPAPTEDDLRRYYEDNREQFTLPRQVVVDELRFPIGENAAVARQDPDDALLKLRSGANFLDIAQEIPNSILATALPVAERVRDPEWDGAVFSLVVGETSDVFRAGDSFYLVRLLDKQSARVQPLEDVRPFVLAAVEPQIRDDWFVANAGKTLFTLKSSRYTVGEFYREYQELPFTVQAQFAGSDGMKDLAERLIERLLLVADANDQLLDVEGQPQFDEARLQVLSQMLHQEEVDDQIDVTDEEILQFYEENQDIMTEPPQARIRYIRIGLGNSEEEAAAASQRADEVYEKLVPGLFQTGEDFAAVAQEYSEDPETAANGGELPRWIGGGEDILAEIELHDFNDIVLSLPLNNITPPFQFGGSLYIVQIIERSEPKLMSLEEVRPLIEEILGQQQHDEREAELRETLLEQAGFEFYQPVLEEYLRQLPTPEPFPIPLESPSS
jgi:parvulin-like peptidyl-prolyl isomerase